LTVPFCANALDIVELPSMFKVALFVRAPRPDHVELRHVTNPSSRLDGPLTVNVLLDAKRVASAESIVNPAMVVLTFSVTV
jgi:Mg/Co/Ni transporter MgtE